MPDQNLFLRALPGAVLDKLKPRLRAHDFPAGQVLFSTGNKVTNVYFMRSGAVSLVSELSDGQMIESAMVGRDSLVGGGAALDDRDAVYKAIVQVPGNGLLLDVDVARQVARDSELFRTAIIRHEQIILAQAQQSAACNAAHNLDQRLARWLLRVRDVTGSDTFDLTQEFIANMLGVRRTSVSIIANTMLKAGRISYRRGHISIDQLEELQAAACECYSTVKNLYDRMAKTEESSHPAVPVR
jgi:CRP-like cAMP-binding protein